MLKCDGVLAPKSMARGAHVPPAPTEAGSGGRRKTSGAPGEGDLCLEIFVRLFEWIENDADSVPSTAIGEPL